MSHKLSHASRFPEPAGDVVEHLAHFYLAAALALADRTAEAAEAAAIGMARMPAFTIGRFRAQARNDNLTYRKQRELIMAGMRSGGVPEWGRGARFGRAARFQAPERSNAIG